MSIPSYKKHTSPFLDDFPHGSNCSWLYSMGWILLRFRDFLLVFGQFSKKIFQDNGFPFRDSSLDSVIFCWWFPFSSWQFPRKLITGWWFGTFFIFAYIWNNHPNWLIFFRGVQTTNQLGYTMNMCMYVCIYIICIYIYRDTIYIYIISCDDFPIRAISPAPEALAIQRGRLVWRVIEITGRGARGWVGSAQPVIDNIKLKWYW